MSNDSSPIAAFVLLIVSFVVYFLPTFIAARRKHHNATGIFVLDLFLGWTGIGWLAALIWSVSAVREPQQPVTVVTGEADKYQKLERLAALKEKGALSQQEYDLEKAKLLG